MDIAVENPRKILRATTLREIYSLLWVKVRVRLGGGGTAREISRNTWRPADQQVQFRISKTLHNHFFPSSVVRLAAAATAPLRISADHLHAPLPRLYYICLIQIVKNKTKIKICVATVCTRTRGVRSIRHGNYTVVRT